MELSADEARTLGQRVKHAMEEVEALAVSDAQKAAAAILHRRLNRLARAIAARWTDLYPADPTTFSTGDKPDDGDGD